MHGYVMLIVAAAAAVGCASVQSVDASARLSATWLDDASRLLAAARASSQSGELLASGRPAVDDVARQLDDIVGRSPSRVPELNAQQRAAVEAKLDELARTRVALDQVGATIVLADQHRGTTFPQAADDVAAAVTGDQWIRSELKKIARAALEDLACDRAASMLFPEEREKLRSEGWQRYVPDEVEPAVESVVNYADRKLANAVGGPWARQLVAWDQYVNGILEKSGRYVQGITGYIQAPDWQTTRAYYYYARLCLRLPR